MKKYRFMGEKYPLSGNIPTPALFPIPHGYECIPVCRYADGYVYRVLREFADETELPWQGYIYLFSVNKNSLYISDIYDRIKIHMTDFEHGLAYATGFEFLSGENSILAKSDGEIWCDEDTEKLIKIFKQEKEKNR